MVLRIEKRQGESLFCLFNLVQMNRNIFAIILTDTADGKVTDCCFDEFDEMAVRATSPELIDTTEELQDTASNIR